MSQFGRPGSLDGPFSRPRPGTVDMVRICCQKSRVPSWVAPGTQCGSLLLWYQVVPGRRQLKGAYIPIPFRASMLEGRDPSEAESRARRSPVQARLCYRSLTNHQHSLHKRKSVPTPSNRRRWQGRSRKWDDYHPSSTSNKTPRKRAPPPFREELEF